MGQQPALDIERSTVRTMHEAAQPRLANHAMTGNDERDGIAAACLADCLRAGIDLRGQLAVTSGLAAGNSQHRLPYLALVMRAVELEGKINLEIGMRQIGLQLPTDFPRHRTRRRQLSYSCRKKLDAQQIRVRAADAKLAERRWNNGLELHARIISVVSGNFEKVVI